jgi:hypothetical protein
MQPGFRAKHRLMSRGFLVGLACVAGMLVWVLATWPVPPEVEDSDAAPAYSEPAREPAAAAPPAPQPSAASKQPHTDPEPGAVEQAPAPEAEPEPESPESPEAEADKIFSRENGPLAEYKAQFEKEPRDSGASEVEQVVRSAFNPGDSPTPVFRSVLCRETICRIETRFSAETLGGYVAAMTRLVHGKFDSKLASERTSLAQAGEVSVTVYAKRPTQLPGE